jgi:hypothetical protein
VTEQSCEKYRVHEPIDKITHCEPKDDTHNGPIGYFLYNSDYTNVMQELSAADNNYLQKRETVSCSVGASPPLAVPVSSSPAGDNKNGLLVTNDENSDCANIGNNVPKANDNDSTINAYLDIAFPKYVTTSTSDGTSEQCTSPFKEYDKFPTFNTSYRSSTKMAVNYKSTRPDWEPYDWFFSQIRWSQSDSDHTYTFCELAIAAHILTGGATSSSQDLCTKINCMSMAFKRYFQKQMIDGKNYKAFFQPSNKVKTLTSIGCDNLLGIRRTPYFSASPGILKEVRLIAWKAVQHWEVSARITRFGEDFHLKSKLKSCWTPDSVLWLHTTMERRKQDKLASLTASVLSNVNSDSQGNSSVILISSAVSSALSSPAPSNKNVHLPDSSSSASAAVIECFYGHKVSSSTDYHGREQWRFSPSSPPWPGVPPARPLCQRCYLQHRNAYLQGDSQYSFLHLFVKQRFNPIPSTIGGASSSTERPPG